RRPHHSAGERLFDPQGARFVNRDDDMPYGTTVFVLRLRLRMLQRPRSDPKQRPSDDHWHEKQMSQTQTTHPPPCYRATIPLVATHHTPPVHFPVNGIASPCTLTLHVADPRDRRRPEHCVGTACRGLGQQAAYDQGLRALARFDHCPLIQVPTVPIVAITATRRMATSTVYSIKEAPSSSLPRRRSRFTICDIATPPMLGCVKVLLYLLVLLVNRPSQ